METVSATMNAENMKAFLQALRDLGYVEGQNLVLEYRSAEGRSDRFSSFAAELVGLHVDLLLTKGTPATLAAKQATSTIAVVTTALASRSAPASRRALLAPAATSRA